MLSPGRGPGPGQLPRPGQLLRPGQAVARVWEAARVRAGRCQGQGAKLAGHIVACFWTIIEARCRDILLDLDVQRQSGRQRQARWSSEGQTVQPERRSEGMGESREPWRTPTWCTTGIRARSGTLLGDTGRSSRSMSWGVWMCKGDQGNGGKAVRSPRDQA